jgi:hypothetical protein
MLGKSRDWKVIIPFHVCKGKCLLTTVCGRVRKMLMISPTGKEVPIGQTLADDEYIGMTRSVLVFFPALPPKHIADFSLLDKICPLQANIGANVTRSWGLQA